MAVWRVYCNHQFLGWFIAESGNEAISKAKEQHANLAGAGAMRAVKDTLPPLDRFSKEMLSAYLNALLRVNVPWERLSRDHLLVLCHALQRLVDQSEKGEVA